MIVVGGG